MDDAKHVFKELKKPYFIALLLIALVPFFPEYFSFVLILGALIFTHFDIKSNPRPFRIGTIGKLLMLYCGYMAITCLFSITPMQSALAVAMWWFFVIGYLLIVNLLTSQERVDSFLLCITVVASVIGLIACIQYRLSFLVGTNITSIWNWLDKIVFQWVPFKITLMSYPLRAYATFPNPNMLAQYLVMVAPFVTCFNFIRRREGLRYFSRVALFLTFAGVLFSFSRGGYLAMLFLAGVLIIINFRRRFAAVSLYVVSTLLFLPEEVVNRFFTIRTNISNTVQINTSNSIRPGPSSTTTSDIINNSGEALVGDRWKIWRRTFECIEEKPLFGYGAGTEPSASLFREVGINSPHAHNLLFQLMIEGGVVSVICIASILFAVLYNGYRLMRNGSDSSFWMGFATAAFAVCFTIHGVVDYALTTPKLVCCFITLLALCEQAIQLYDSNFIPLRWLKRKTA